MANVLPTFRNILENFQILKIAPDIRSKVELAGNSCRIRQIFGIFLYRFSKLRPNLGRLGPTKAPKSLLLGAEAVKYGNFLATCSNRPVEKFFVIFL